MAVKMMVGVDFYAHLAPAPAIQKLRQDYDPKIEYNSRITCVIVPPFTIEDRFVSKITEEISEVVENFFFGGEKLEVEFSGMDVFQSNGSNLIYLNPSWDEDMTYAFEAMNDACRDLIPHHERAKNLDRPFLVVGRFGTSMRSDVPGAIEKIKASLSFPLKLRVEAFTVYKRQQGSWGIVESFDPSL